LGEGKEENEKMTLEGANVQLKELYRLRKEQETVIKRINRFHAKLSQVGEWQHNNDFFSLPILFLSCFLYVFMLDMCNLWVRSHFHDPYYKIMNTEEEESETE
jgi:hypothetical protein